MKPDVDSKIIYLQKPRIALALSGGGFRAAIFHLGVLRRLAELGWLSQIDIISTVSGGSILGAFMALRWGGVESGEGDWSSFERSVVHPFVDLVTSRNFIQNWALQLPLVPIRKLRDRTYTRTKLAADLLSRRFYGNQLCNQLPTHPYLIINGTSLVSIRAWRFTPHGLGDSRFGHAGWGDKSLRVGEAVAASAAFPPVFTPARIRAKDYSFSAPVYGEPQLPHYEFVPVSDGGVYDNLGLEAVGKESILPGGVGQIGTPDFLVVSDAGYPAQYYFRSSGLPGLAECFLLYRVDAIAREQAAALRRRDLMREFSNPTVKRKGLLVMLGSQIDRIPAGGGDQYRARIGSAFCIPPQFLQRIKAVRTNLDRFSRLECEALMYHAYTMTDTFLWYYRNSFPEAYRVSDAPNPEWRIEFTEKRVSEWTEALRNSNRTRM